MMATARLTKCAFYGFTLAITMLVPQASQAAAPQDAVLGTWLTEDGQSKVDVVSGKAADGSAVFSGNVTWLKVSTRDGEPVHDSRNENAALRDRPILGLEILSGFKFTGPATWAGGELYAPRNGKSFPAVLTLTPDGRLEVKVSAGIVSKTVYWTR
jgi:uncharacterized protein (DUF2147 family)